MTKTQLKVLNELLTDPTFRGKRQLGHLIWANTTEPKYSLGDCYRVSDVGRRINGHVVKDFGGKIVEIIPDLLSEEYRYRFECVYDQEGCEAYKFYVLLYEHDVSFCMPASDNVTYFL